MPFENELAKYEPLRRISDSDVVKNLVHNMKIKKSSDVEQKLNTISKCDITPGDFIPQWVISIDGSHQPTPVRNGYPGAEIGYITIASVITNLFDIKKLSKEEFIDPKKIRDAEKADSLDTVVPGTNVIFGKCSSAKESFRKVIFDEFKRFKLFEDGESLLETYEVLLKWKIDGKGDPRPPKCPIDIDDCDEDYIYGYGEYPCNCNKNTLYSTDALRLHELMNPTGTNGELYGQVMQVMEKLSLINILRYFERKKWWSLFQNLVFIMDGPLAVFSTASWMAKSITKELARLNDCNKKNCSHNIDIMIIGVEKSGTFVNHFNELDIDHNGVPNFIDNQSIFLLSDEYIKNNIVFSDSVHKTFGQDTYYGRKFLYKNSIGYKLVGTVAFFNDYQKNIRTANLDQFPRIGDVMNVLDQLSSSMYANSISPLINAHSEASIPLNLGKRILEQLAKNIINKNNE